MRPASFQLTAARRRLPATSAKRKAPVLFQLTAARRRLRLRHLPRLRSRGVSTHSRSKAAAKEMQGHIRKGEFQLTAARRRLQPEDAKAMIADLFQLTAARRRLPQAQSLRVSSLMVSTHSRPKAAALALDGLGCPREVSTHSRPKAAALAQVRTGHRKRVSTHSRPKAAASAGNGARAG